MFKGMTSTFPILTRIRGGEETLRAIQKIYISEVMNDLMTLYIERVRCC